MNILFIASMPIRSASDRGIFPDMVRELSSRGHTVYAVSACERREALPTMVTREGNTFILHVKTLNNRRVSFLEKTFAVITTPFLFERAIKKHMRNEAIDLVVYSTPPVTIYPLVLRLKRRFNASTYLILKDIWPQAMVDLGLIKKGGGSWRVFDWLSKKLNSVSDHIGTMSEGNSRLLLSLYPFIPDEKVEVCPNSVEPISPEEVIGFVNKDLRKEYSIPDNATLFSYGGSFNKPQGIPFLIDILESYLNDHKVFFFLCGAGTEYHLVEEWRDLRQPCNVVLLPYLSKPEYFALLCDSDVGMVFLDSRFTVPNMPSRALDYMQFSLPLIAAVDENTDFREIVEEGGFGLCSIAGNLYDFRQNVERLLGKGLRREMGSSGRHYLEKHWSVSTSCDTILGHYANQAEGD